MTPIALPAEGVGMICAKVAVTFCAEFIETRQEPVPPQAPDQPVKVKLDPAVAVKVIELPCEKATEQAPGQLIPAGELETVPVPEMERANV